SEVFVQSNLSGFYNTIGQFEIAIDIGNEVLNNSQQIGRSNLYRNALLNLGIAHHNLGKLDKAAALLGDAIDLCQQTADGWIEVNSWLRMGHLHIDRKQFAEALNAFEKAEALQTDIDETSVLAETWSGLAATYMGLGDIKNAKRYAQQALPYMHADKIDESWAWARAYFYVCQILAQIQDERAATIIRYAIDARDTRAAKMSDESRRHTYLWHVSENHMLDVLYEWIVESG
ncbi:MAG: tetratricopeptide repeat protein, partial [Chloroflexota bacterium]